MFHRRLGRLLDARWSSAQTPFTGHTDPINTMVLRPDGRSLATASVDGNAQPETAGQPGALRGATSAIGSCERRAAFCNRALTPGAEACRAIEAGWSTNQGFHATWRSGAGSVESVRLRGGTRESGRQARRRVPRGWHRAAQTFRSEVRGLWVNRRTRWFVACSGDIW